VNFAFGEGDLQKQILFDINMEVATGEIVLLTAPAAAARRLC
jgi:putative ABC transport system ATP-binding protein